MTAEPRKAAEERKRRVPLLPRFSEAQRSMIVPLLGYNSNPYGGPVKTVTAALGFRCTDGVVLAADTQMTVPNVRKFKESKIITASGTKPAPWFVYASNDIQFTKAAIARIADRLKRTKMVAPLHVMHGEARAIYDEYSKRYKNPVDKGKYLWTLAAIQRERTVALYEISGDEAFPVTQPCTSIGLGTDAVAVLSEFLYPFEMTVNEASFVAAYILGQIKEHVDKCGKQSQILKIWPRIVSHDGSVDHDYLSLEEIKELEQGYQRIQAALRPLLLRRGDLLNPRENAAVFNKEIKEFIRVVRRERRHRGCYAGVRENAQ